MSNELLVVLFGGGTLSALVVALISVVTGRAGRRADAAKSIAESAAGITVATQTLLVPLEKKITKLSGELAAVTARVDELEEALHVEERRTRALVRYILALVSVIRKLDPDHAVLNPPAEVAALLIDPEGDVS